MADPVSVAVLGGCGFIGHHVAQAFHDRGYRVRIVDIHHEPWRPLPVPWWHHDLTDYSAALRAVDSCQWVVNLAADMGGVEWFHSDRDWGSALTNAVITSNVLRACAASGVERVFQASSACTYPVEQQQTSRAPKLTEGIRAIGTPDQLYGMEKRIAALWCEKAPIDARAGIFHTIYGPGSTWEGQRAKFPGAVARKAIEARTTGRIELIGGGWQSRSWHYINDAVRAVVALMEHPRNIGPVNIGASGAVSCRDVAAVCLRAAGLDPEDIEFVAVDGPVGVVSRDCDTTKLNETVGHSQTSWVDGFTRTVEWLDGVLKLPSRPVPEHAVRPPVEVR